MSRLVAKRPTYGSIFFMCHTKSWCRSALFNSFQKGSTEAVDPFHLAYIFFLAFLYLIKSMPLFIFSDCLKQNCFILISCCIPLYYHQVSLARKSLATLLIKLAISFNFLFSSVLNFQFPSFSNLLLKDIAFQYFFSYFSFNVYF